MQVGIFGGCFDPPHKGHLAVAEAALRSAALDQVAVIPAAVASPKERGIVASASDRLNMCRMCFGPEPRFVVSELETRRSE